MLKAADVMDIGMSGDPADSVVLYPPADATAVPVCFNGYESPTPKAPPGGFPSGYIATVQFGSNVGFKVDDHRLLAPDGTALDHVFLAPFADAAHGITKDTLADNWVAMYANEQLENNVTYTVIIDFEQGGKPLHVEWSFTTGSKVCR